MACDVDRTCVALVTALANGEHGIFRSLAQELGQDGEHAVIHLAGFAIGLLRCQGDAAAILAQLGPELEQRRG